MFCCLTCKRIYGFVAHFYYCDYLTRARAQVNSGEGDCIESCWAMPECLICGMRKKPYGRSAPLEAANGYCDGDCPGYHQEPKAGHYWPGEEPELRTRARISVAEPKQ